MFDACVVTPHGHRGAQNMQYVEIIYIKSTMWPKGILACTSQSFTNS